MNSRKLGKTGYEVSEIGLGCWQLGGDFGPVGDETAADILKTARSLDVNFWDTADVYGGGQSESRIGAFKDKKSVLVATKLGRGSQFEGMTKYNRQRVKDSLAGSIKRLGVETLDLAQLHCIPIDVLRDGEIFTWMDDMRDAGMVRHWGASVQTVEEGMLALRSANCTALQTIFNLFARTPSTAFSRRPRRLMSGSSCACRSPRACCRASTPRTRSSRSKTIAPTTAMARLSMSARPSRACRSTRVSPSPTSSNR